MFISIGKRLIYNKLFSRIYSRIIFRYSYVYICTALLILLFIVIHFQNPRYDVAQFSNILSAEVNLNLLSVKKASNNISCHLLTEGDLLPNADETVFPEGSMFLHETSCKGGLNSREACSIEAVARHNPEREINVLFSSPITKSHMDKNIAFAVIQRMKNVRVARIHLDQYGKGTPVEYFIANLTNFAISNYSVNNEANLLRLLTLYKHGGIYLDLDVLATKSFDDLPDNWVALESDNYLGSAIMAMNKRTSGRRFTETSMKYFISRYSPNVWGYNGPALLTTVMKKLCTESHPRFNQHLTPGTICQGITVMDKKYFYPIHYANFMQYFSKSVLNETQTYTHHLWHKMSKDIKIIKTKSYYYRLAQENCPQIVALYGKYFGL